MPQFSDTSPPSNPSPIRLLLLGHTGSGKTGSLMSLAAMGFQVRILDLDNGVEVLSGFTLNREKSIYRQAKPGLWTQALADSLPSRISYVTRTEKVRIVGAKAVPQGTAWKAAMDQLTSWTDSPDVKLGNIASWDSNCVLVIDGLSRLCEAAMNFQLAMNGRLGKSPQVGTAGDNDYTHAYAMVRDFLDLLKSDELKCHVILICHIQFQEETGGKMAGGPQKEIRGFPQTVGRALAPQIGQYFNHTLRARSTGSAPNVKRVIVTNNDENIDLKNTNPLAVRREYPLETGLAEYFKDIGRLPTRD